MDYVLYLLRALYRVKWWILLGTALITAIVYFRTGNLKGVIMWKQPYTPV